VSSRCEDKDKIIDCYNQDDYEEDLEEYLSNELPDDE
jgi:hypothetical protein